MIEAPDTADGLAAATAGVMGAAVSTGAIDLSVVLGCAIGVVLVAVIRRVPVHLPAPPPAPPPDRRGDL